MALTSVRKLLAPVRSTPLHPQWLAFGAGERGLPNILATLHGVVVDIGCGEAGAKRYLPDMTDYIGMDYYQTVQEWYHTKPDLFGDAQSLPFPDDCVDHVLLLDVLEHLPAPDRCLSEIYRVLRAGGTLVLQVPFLYPLHDTPLDFHRWTRYGLAEAATRHNYGVENCEILGRPLEAAALNVNIAISKLVLDWFRRRSPLAALGLALPLIVPMINILGWLGARLGTQDDFMPVAYRMVWRKR